MVKRKTNSNSATSRDIVERTFELAVNVIKLVNVIGKDSVSSKVLSSQLLRAATSIGANVEEAQAAESKADFIHKYNIALKEARETKYWLRLFEACGIIPKQNISALLQESDEISRVIARIIINSRKSQ
jgi:four helix bundle protein